MFYECSAKKSININEAFENFIYKLFDSKFIYFILKY